MNTVYCTLYTINYMYIAYFPLETLYTVHLKLYVHHCILCVVCILYILKCIYTVQCTVYTYTVHPGEVAKSCLLYSGEEDYPWSRSPLGSKLIQSIIRNILIRHKLTLFTTLTRTSGLNITFTLFFIFIAVLFIHCSLGADYNLAKITIYF